jgi:hypothetical protein
MEPAVSDGNGCKSVSSVDAQQGVSLLPTGKPKV